MSLSGMRMARVLSDKAPVVSGQIRCMASITDEAKEKLGKVTEKVGDAFTDQGKVGKKFNPDRPEGTAGQTADEVGGAFDKHGKVGHQFTRDGSIGGRVQDAAESAKEKGKDMKKDANT